MVVIFINEWLVLSAWMYAYVLLNTMPLKEHLVYSTLAKTKEVEELFPLFGEYDIIFRITVENLEEARKIIEEKVRTIDGVLSTKTLLGY